MSRTRCYGQMHLFLSLFLLLELSGNMLTHAIYHPDAPTPKPKVKQRVDLKPVIPSTTARPPVRVYSRRERPERQSWEGIGRSWEHRGREEGRRGGDWKGEEWRGPWNTGPYGGAHDRRKYPHYDPELDVDHGYYDKAESSAHPKLDHPVTIPSHSPGPGRSHSRPKISRDGIRSPASEVGHLSCPAPSGLFPYPQDCSKYISCDWERPFLMSCGPGTVFNPDISACDWPHNVDCPSSEDLPSGGIGKGLLSPDPPAIPIPPPEEPSPPDYSSLDSLFGLIPSPAPGIVNSIVDHAKEKLDHVRNKVDWTYQRAKDKGKRLLNKLGVKNSASLCLRPDGLFPYLKDCKKFVNCHKSKPHLQTCSPGTLFNAIKEVCDFPSKVVCPKSRATPAKEASVVIAPPSGQKIRLRGSNVPWAGYVQVEVGGRWRVITDTLSQWTKSDADVVCRSLGYEKGAESKSQGRTFGLVSRLEAEYRVVECMGHEENLQQCRLERGTQEEVDKTVVGVRCRMNWVSECGFGGVNWGRKCYHYTRAQTLVTHAQAREICAQNGARLLSIQSQAESDFVSELLTAAAGDVEPGFHTGGVRTEIFGDVFWLWQNSTSAGPDMPFANWWPGWNSSSGGDSRPPKRPKHPKDSGGGQESVTQCIVLRDNFPVTRSGSSVTKGPAEYFFMELTDCAEGFHFVCETDKKDIGCIEGRGESYQGEASLTVEGEVCALWGQPRVQEKLGHLANSQIPLVANHCANPDGDDLPWCYTSKGTVGFCDIPRCPQRREDRDVPTIIEEDSSCGADKFACANGGCIHQEWQCDGQQDCSDGSDEEGCRDYSAYYTKKVNQRLKGREVEKWLYTLKTTCAARCSQAKNFLCLSFNYESGSETCILSDSNVGRSGGLVAESGWDYYELETGSVDCSRMFSCRDGKCLEQSQVCNGKRECAGGEDEDLCDGRVNFEVRLVNGSGNHEGRVEVKAFGRWGTICDDMWGLPEGDVLCQQLGFNLGAREVFFGSHFGNGEGQYLMDDLNCLGDESSLSECDFAGWGEHDCGESEAAGVTCFKPGDTCGRDQWKCSNGKCVGIGFLCDTVDDCKDNSDEERTMCQAPLEARLVNGARTGEGVPLGRVELRYLGVWGTICDDDFGLEEGHVVCRMMGWEGASRVHKNNTFGPGSGRVWIDDLRCIGYETSVSDCQHLPWGQNNCDHTEDVGVECSNTPVDRSREETVVSPTAGTTEEVSLPVTCGQRLIEDNPNAPTLEKPKVVSGHTPPQGAHPWMVNINLLTRTGPTQWCGGAILTEDSILTAAHCLHKYPSSTYIVRVGDFNTEEEEEEEQEFRVASMAIHHLFDKGPYLNNDIAILKIKRKNGEGVRFGRYVQPLCLVPPRWNYPPYRNCTVAGWGSLGIALGRSRVLQSALLPILPDEICKADNVYGDTRLTEGMFCAGYLEGGIDTCQGDSGGPMVCIVDGRHTVVGITSWGHGCARANKPGVYTKVTQFLPWLYSNLV
ncbi:uncharacterized protein LOC135216798 [Macrobrachium nipponense]|uniref:uncharacterized protein LOC135216798 n=1 Tax=Macrobrachium nipponense TaxID=159736 RepID=UPI0030C89A5A